MTTITHPQGMLSLSYHIVYEEGVRQRFREDWVSVAVEFGLSKGAKDAIMEATQRGVYSQDDAKAICEFMKQDLQDSVGGSGAEAESPLGKPPFGMLSATYHVVIAGQDIPLESFDLNDEEAESVRTKNVDAMAGFLLKDFEQRYEEIYTLAW